MEVLVISPDFTIEDIHKLRENNYYFTKDMTPQERWNFYNEPGRAFQRDSYMPDLKGEHTHENTMCVGA